MKEHFEKNVTVCKYRVVGAYKNRYTIDIPAEIIHKLPNGAWKFSKIHVERNAGPPITVKDAVIVKRVTKSNVNRYYCNLPAQLCNDAGMEGKEHVKVCAEW